MIIRKLRRGKSDEQKETLRKDKEFAKKIRERDGYKCVICGSPERLNAHHLICREQKEWKYDTDNGILLCVRHHKFCRIISAHNNPIMFAVWLKNNRAYQWQVAESRFPKMDEI